MTRTRLVFLSADPAQPSPYLIAAEGVMERGALAPDGPAPELLRTVLVVPGSDTLYRRLALPARRDAQAAAAALILLEDQLAGPREDLHAAVGQADAAGRRPVVVVDRVVMQGWLARAAALGLDPDAVVPDYLMLPEPAGEEVVAAPFGRLTALRAADRALSVEPDMVPLVAGGPVRELEGPELEAALIRAAEAPLVNLRQRAFAPAAERRLAGGWRRAAALAAVVLVSPLAIWAAQWLHADLEAGRMEREIAAIARPALPSAPAGADLAPLLDRRLTALLAGERFPAAAVALFNGVQGIEGMQLEGLVYAPDGALRATLSHANYSDIELLRGAVKPAGLKLDENSTASNQGRILSDVTLRSAQ